MKRRNLGRWCEGHSYATIIYAKKGEKKNTYTEGPYSLLTSVDLILEGPYSLLTSVDLSQVPLLSYCPSS